MRKIVKIGMMIVAIAALVGCSGGSKKGIEIPDTTFANIHETILPGIELRGDFSLTYNCNVESASGSLDNSELEFDLTYDGTTLHMPLFDGKTFLSYEDGTSYEFTEEDKAKGRKEPGSVYSSNKIPSNGVTLTIQLNRSGDVISGEATYEGGAMGKGNHQFWICHYYSDVKLPEAMILHVTGQDVQVSKATYILK